MSKTWQDYKRLPHSHSFQNDTTIIVGDMVKINSLLGVVRFIGTTDFKTGTWAGIELDQIGLGKNDGSVDGECAPILTFFSKRYFHCPSKTGLFAPVAKLVKINRPNTPHQKANIYAGDDDITSLHKKIETLTAENEFLKLKQPSLQKQLVELEADHLRVLAEKNDELQAKEEEILKLNLIITEVKQAGLDSLEMLESIVQRHQKKVNFLEQELANEKNKRQVLLLEQENLRNAGLEAVESNESALNQLESVKQHWSSEKKKLEHEFESSQTKLMQLHHHEIKTLLQDINVLEIVLQSKIDKENVLSQSLKREKSYSNKILIDAKSNKLHIKTKSRSSFNSFNDHRISAYHYHTPLDTPIEEEEEDLASCTLCGMDGHDLFHCSILPNRRHTIHPHLS